MKKLSKKIRDFYYRFRPLPDYYGKEFRKIYSLLEETQTWHHEQLKNYKLEKLRALIKYAAENVPYYKKLFKELDMNSEDIKSFEDYAKIPVLTKDFVRENLEQLKSKNFPSHNPYYTETSGTTGNPTLVYRSKYHETFRKAVVWRFFKNFGHDFKDNMAVVNRPLGYGNSSPLYEYDRLENQLIVNAYYIISRQYEKVIDVIRKFKPKSIWAHPNLLSVTAEYAHEKGIEPLQVPMVFTYAEKIVPHLRKYLLGFYKGNFYEYYGNRENTIAAWGYANEHFFEVSEYCHLEVENSHDNTGDLISTSLHNYAMPLIRYNSQDFCTMKGFTNPEIPYPEIKLIGGRGKNLLLTREGLIAPYIITYFEKKDFLKFREYQMEQVSLDEVIFRIVPRENYDRKKDETTLLQYASESLENKFRVKIEYVDNIPYTKSGKYRHVISDLALNYLKNKD